MLIHRYDRDGIHLVASIPDNQQAEPFADGVQLQAGETYTYIGDSTHWVIAEEDQVRLAFYAGFEAGRLFATGAKVADADEACDAYVRGLAVG